MLCLDICIFFIAKSVGPNAFPLSLSAKETKRGDGRALRLAEDDRKGRQYLSVCCDVLFSPTGDSYRKGFYSHPSLKQCNDWDIA